MRYGILRLAEYSLAFIIFWVVAVLCRLTTHIVASRQPLSFLLADRSLASSVGASLQPGYVPIHVGRIRELNKAAGVWPHPFKATGAQMAGQQRMVEGRLPGLRHCIAEDVWLLEKTGAPMTFLVFGWNTQVSEF
jgi:hypothetical protein